MVFRISTVGQCAVDIDLLGAIGINHPNVAGVGWLRAVEDALVVGAVVVVITAARLVLLTHAHHR